MANYSVDADLAPYESDLTWALDGLADFSTLATEAKRVIDDYLVGTLEVEADDLANLAPVTLSQLKSISVFYVLYMIFNKHGNGPDDSFGAKAQGYLARYNAGMTNLKVRIGTNADPSELYASGQIGLG